MESEGRFIVATWSGDICVSSYIHKDHNRLPEMKGKAVRGWSPLVKGRNFRSWATPSRRQALEVQVQVIGAAERRKSIMGTNPYMA
jgi:hypothetical protein